MNTAELRELKKLELPQLVRNDPEIQDLILRPSRQDFAPKQQTSDRIEMFGDSVLVESLVGVVQ